MLEIIEWIQNNMALTIIGAVTLIQIVPIEVNPWTWFANLIKNAIGITSIQKEIETIKADTQQERVDNWRWNILNFGNSCRNDVMHSKDEWTHVISQLRNYEAYCESKSIENGVIEEEAKYLRGLYQERLTKNDFLC